MPRRDSSNESNDDQNNLGTLRHKYGSIPLAHVVVKVGRKMLKAIGLKWMPAACHWVEARDRPCLVVQAAWEAAQAAWVAAQVVWAWAAQATWAWVAQATWAWAAQAA